jgi:protein involved in polysaccharide export with SLBB domain
MKNQFKMMLASLILASGTISCSGKREKPIAETTIYKCNSELEIDQDAPVDELVDESDRDADFDIHELYDPFQPGEYTFAKGDLIEISIFGQPDTTVSALPIAPDGKIYYLFLDGISAEGRSIDDVASEMEEKLQGLFVSPEVSIVPHAIKGQKFVVMGLVNSPGEFYFDSALTLRDAIAKANGLLEIRDRDGSNRPLVSLKDSFLVRNGMKAPIRFEEILINQNSRDVYLRPGDYIYIAASVENHVYRIGAVSESAELIHYDGMTLLGMLASGNSSVGSGFLSGAFLEGTVLLRGELDDPEVHFVDLRRILEGKDQDFYLLPGDVVYVPYEKYKFQKECTAAALDRFQAEFIHRDVR